MPPRRAPCRRRRIITCVKGYRTLQCECCGGRFPSGRGLENHRTVSSICVMIVTILASPTVPLAYSMSLPLPLLESQPHIDNARMVDQIPESMNCSNEDDDATNKINEDANEEIEDGNNSSVQFNPFSGSSHGIETSFDNTTLNEALEGFNFHYEKEVNESSGDSDRFSDDNGSTSNDENNNKPNPIGGNAAMRAQVSLLRLLEESSVPIGLFDKIMDWASKAKSSG
eukprot:scaffold12615_cov57-Attheya_sp.AAC.2